MSRYPKKRFKNRTVLKSVKLDWMGEGCVPNLLPLTPFRGVLFGDIAGWQRGAEFLLAVGKFRISMPLTCATHDLATDPF
jgi:hypothetical protein